MMKKLMVLSLVLGMASLATATVSLSVVDNGDGTYTVDILGAYTTPLSGDNWSLIADTSVASITGGTPMAVVDLSNTIIGPSIEANATLPNPAGTDGPYGATRWINLQLSMPETQIYIDFTVTALADGVVSLYSGFVEVYVFKSFETN